MPRRFRKVGHLSLVIIPPHGRVHENDVLVGDQYAQYAPYMLEELPPEGDIPVRPEPVEPNFRPRPDPLAGELAKVAAETVPLPAVEDQLPPPPEEIFVPELADSAAPSETATVAEEAPKKKRGRPRKKPVEPAAEEAPKE